MTDNSFLPAERGVSAGHSLEPMYMPEARHDGQSGAQIPYILLRRWKVVALVAIIVCAICLPLIWLKIKPEYTAAGAIEVAPVVQQIVYDEEAKLPSYSGYMNTQATLMTSSHVLFQVLEDPRIRNLPYIQEASDPTAVLRRGLKAEVVRRTHLLQISMTGTDPAAAAEIANATIRAYMRVEGGTESSTQDRRLTALEQERAAAAEKMRSLNERLAEFVDETGVTEPDTRNEILVAKVQVLQQELVRIDMARIGLEAQKQFLENTPEKTPDPAELDRPRKEYVNADPTVKALTASITDLEQQLDFAVDRWPDEKKTQRDLLQKVLTSMRAKLEAKRAEVEEEFAKIVVKERGLETRTTSEDIDKRLALLVAQKEQIETELKGIEEELDSQDVKVVARGQNTLAMNRIQVELDLTRDLHNTISQRIQQLRVERQRPARISIAYLAEMPRGPSRDKRKKYSVVLVMGAVLFGCAFVVFMHEMRLPVESPKDVEERCGLRVLGTTPRFEDIGKRLQPRDLADDCRTIWVNLSLARQHDGCHVLAVTSAHGGEGKTSFAVNFASGLALRGRRVLLIDGDLRKPELACYLDANNESGLQNVLAGACSIEEGLRKTPVPGLDILPAGCPREGQSEPLANGRLEGILEALRSRYDEIVIDTPPVLAMPDAKLWARYADAVLFVARSGRTGGRDLMEANERMQQAGARIPGVVLTGVKMRDSYEKYQQRYAPDAAAEPVSEEDRKRRQILLGFNNVEDKEEEQAT